MATSQGKTPIQVTVAASQESESPYAEFTDAAGDNNSKSGASYIGDTPAAFHNTLFSKSSENVDENDTKTKDDTKAETENTWSSYVRLPEGVKLPDSTSLVQVRQCAHQCHDNMPEVPEVEGCHDAAWNKEEHWITKEQHNLLVPAFYMSCFAMLGVLVRIALAQMFGEECANPGTVGWIRTETPLCVTADGETQRQGGIIFADLPANMLGSFILGMMQSGASLSLPVSDPMIFLNTKSKFQNWNAIHLAIRTGFCGSLTTFSSWNSEMVVMIFGTGQDYHSQFLRAVLGYIIGLEVALGSFVLGKNIALWLHRYMNPGLAREADAAALKEKEGVFINRNLPTYERRYLPELDDIQEDSCDPSTLVYLERWKVSTKDCRRVGNEAIADLAQIEKAILVDGEVASLELHDLAAKYKWDINALQLWSEEKAIEEFGEGPKIDHKPTAFTIFVAFPIFLTCYVLLLVGVATVNEDDAYSITYRTMMYSALFAPPGAVLRWKMSDYNGTLSDSWSWFPAGTFAANVAASVLSIAMIAADYVAGADGGEPSFWASGTFRAIKIGFAGSLSTVSTFISEVHWLLQNQPHSLQGYTYAFITLSVSCITGIATYGVVVSSSM